jgi:hypothetical protein
MIIDPAKLMLRNAPKNQAELAIAARDNHLLVYDDCQAVSPWFGSAICKVSKGTSFTGCRGGQEQIVFEGARPVILVGDDEMLLNRELASRALTVRLDPRIDFKSGIGDDFRGVAKIRGALLDIVVHGLGRLSGLKIAAPIRNYEFERWIASCELSRWGLEAHQEAYQANVSEGLTDLAELDPLLITLQDYLAEIKTFRGTAGQLLKKLDAAATIAKGNHWPKSPRALSGRLRRDAMLIPEIEIEFGIREGHNRTRLIAASVKVAAEQPDGDDEIVKSRSTKRSASRQNAPSKVSGNAPLPLFAGQ